MGQLINFLFHNQWAGFPLLFWLYVLIPIGGDKKKRKGKKLSAKQKQAFTAAFESAARRGGMTVAVDFPSVERLEAPPSGPPLLPPPVTAKCRHGNAVPVRTCDWREPVLEGDGQLVAYWCEDCKTELPPTFTPGVREVEYYTSWEVSVYDDYWTTAAHVPRQKHEPVMYRHKNGGIVVNHRCWCGKFHEMRELKG